MAIAYDPAIIQESADRLYSSAQSVMVTYSALGVLAGAAIGYVASPQDLKMAVTAGVALVLGLLGFVLGRESAFRLKLSAQTALCQMRIEANTRSEKRES